MTKSKVTVFFKDGSAPLIKRFAALIQLQHDLQLGKFLSSLDRDKVKTIEITPE